MRKAYKPTITSYKVDIRKKEKSSLLTVDDREKNVVKFVTTREEKCNSLKFNSSICKKRNICDLGGIKSFPMWQVQMLLPMSWRWRTTHDRYAELVWYPTNAIHQICLNGLHYSLGVQPSMSTWPCQIIEVLATWEKFLEAPGYWTGVNRAFNFHTTNVLGCIYGIMVQFELVKLPNWRTLSVHLSGFHFPHGVKLYRIAQRTSYHDTNQPPWASKVRNPSAMWYTCHELVHTNKTDLLLYNSHQVA